MKRPIEFFNVGFKYLSETVKFAYNSLDEAPFLKFANELIPGYRRLTKKEREKFEMTVEGQAFVRLVKTRIDANNSPRAKKTSYEKEGEIAFNRGKEEFIKRLETSKICQPVIYQIIIRVLENEFPDFSYLSMMDKEKIARTVCSRRWQSSQLPKIPEEESGWLKTFNSQKDMLAYGAEIARKKVGLGPTDASFNKEQRSIFVNELIPGYGFLTEAQQKVFEKAKEGQAVANLFFELIQAQTDAESSPLTEKALCGKEELFDRGKEELIERFKTSTVYRQVIYQIIICVLESEVPDFSYLSEESKQIIVKQVFFGRQESAGHLSVISIDWWDWLETFNNQGGLACYRAEIAKNKAEKRASDLVHCFPALSKPNSVYSQALSVPSAKGFVELYFKVCCSKEDTKVEQMEENFLAEILFYGFQKVTAKSIRFIPLDDFNQKQARDLARMIQAAASNQEEASAINSYLALYKNALANYLRAELLSIASKKYKFDRISLGSSLSRLFLRFLENESVKEFSEKVGDAHAFLSMAGMSAQNEVSYFSFIDLLNAYRISGPLTEVKKTLKALLKPFLPLYQEYNEIALYEKSAYLKIFRTVMPLLIIAGFVVLVAALLAPLAIPEIAFLVVMIPTLLIGLFLASQYVSMKNNFYRSLCRGSYTMSEFQVNDRMIAIFGSVAKANLIRDIYIEELKRCDDLENSYSQQIVLTEKEIKLRKENSNRWQLLLIEWYDVHDKEFKLNGNENFGSDTVLRIVQDRLREMACEEVEALQPDLIETQRYFINPVNAVIAELEDSFGAVVACETRVGREADLKAPPGYEAAARFFNHRDKAAAMDLFATNLAPTG